MVFNISLSYSRESFEVFLDLIHNRISYPSVEKAGDVYDICNSLHCDSLCQLLNDDSSERVLSLLIQNQDQNDDNIDFSKYERSITQKIETYLKNPSFCLVSLPSLCRIFADSNQTFSLSSLEQFLIGCMKHHGTGAKILLNNIKYQKPSGLSELNRFLNIMSVDGSTFEIIDSKVDTADFQYSGGFNAPNSQKNFPVQPNNKYYRFIRITSTSKNWINNDQFCLYRVELFGYVKPD